jgi:hypothetical protein
MLLSVTWWKTQGMMSLRRFFVKLFDVKPRDPKDYYSVFRWLVSKRLAFALTLAVGVIGLYYILVLSPVAADDSAPGSASVSVYRYNSIPLKFVKGVVGIKARDGHIAYEGQVDGGMVTGEGKLYGKDGGLIYEGSFDKNMFNGEGRMFYPGGTPKYKGGFLDNLFDGEGELYRPTGTLWHTGAFAGGLRNGKGTQYNAAGTPVFTGTFAADQLLYSEFVGKTTQEAAEMYTGIRSIYSSGDAYCVKMTEIDAVYDVLNGANTLDSEWTINNVIVLRDFIVVEGARLNTVNRLTARFGTPEYYGWTWANFAEAAAIGALGSGNVFGDLKMDAVPVLDDVFEIREYDEDFALYVYAYKADGLLYTFYCPEAGAENFAMYAIESE